MDLDMFLSGMPCCRYMLMKLKYKEDALCFTKFIVNTLHSVDMPANDICGVLAIMSMTIPFSHPLHGYDFYFFNEMEAGVEPEEFVKYVLADTTVASYPHCYEYCKTLDKSTKFCSLCSLSKYYKNEYVCEERDLIRFALESRDNLLYLLDNGLKDCHFSSVVDIHGPLQLEMGVIESPFVISFSYLIWLKMLKYKNTDFYTKNYEERCLVVKSDILDDFITKYSRAFGHSSSISESICAVQVEGFLEKKCPSKKSIDKILATILQETGGREQAGGTAKSNIGESKIVDFYTKKQLSDDGLASEENVSSKDVLPESDSFEETVVPPESIDEMSYAEEVVSFEHTIPENEAKDAVKENEHSESLLPCEIMEVKSRETEEPFEKVDESHTYEESSDDLSFRELGYVYKASSVLYDKSDKAGFFGVPIVKKAELEHFSLFLDEGQQRMVAMLHSQTMNDKRLCVELVVLEDKSTYFLVLYSPKIHAYYHTSLKDGYVKDVVSHLLTIPSISKYSYYPYFVASYLMKSDVYVKGLYSLFSLSAILYGQHNMLIDECLDRMGAYKAEGGVHIKPKGEITSLPLMYMHCYSQIYQKQSRELTSKGLLKELEERNCFDVLLGRYYYQDLYAQKAAVLFTLRDSVGYHFLNEELSYKRDGYVLTYTFKHLPLNLSHLLRELLCRMELKGYFKKYGVMITGVGPSSFSIYVVKEDMRKVDTLIDTTLVFFLRDNGLYGVRYTLSRNIVIKSE